MRNKHFNTKTKNIFIKLVTKFYLSCSTKTSMASDEHKLPHRSRKRIKEIKRKARPGK